MQSNCSHRSLRALTLFFAGLSVWSTMLQAASHTPLRLDSPRPAGRDPSLSAALETLARVVRARNAGGLRNMLAPDVRLDGRVSGVAGVQKLWRFDRASSPLWHGLARALELGGARSRTEDRRVVLPWIAACWPAGTAVSARVAVVVPRAHVLERAADGTRVQAVVGHEVLRLAGAHETAAPGWVKVRTPGRIYGFVRAEQVWSPTELAIELAPRGSSGEWRIVSLGTEWLDRAGAPPFTIPRGLAQ